MINQTGMVLLEIITLASLYIFSMVTGYYITEYLVKPFNFWDVYPYKCIKCLQFWLTLITTASIGYASGSLLIMIGGATLAVGQAIARIITDKNRIVKDDDNR